MLSVHNYVISWDLNWRVVNDLIIWLGVINVITASRENASVIGRTMCKSPKISAMSFTGSTKVGECKQNHMKGVYHTI